MTYLAIDPGPMESAYVLYWESAPIKFQKCRNDLLLEGLRRRELSADVCVIEKIASYGMAVGEEVFETVFWSGQFAEAFAPYLVRRITRLSIKTHLCHSARATDANIRQALIDRYGGKEKAIGRKKTPGVLFGIKADVWAALAVAVTAADLEA